MMPTNRGLTARFGWPTAVLLWRAGRLGCPIGVDDPVLVCHGWVVDFEFGELRFSWSDRKAALNLKNHGVGFEQAATVFLDPLARLYDDPDHSATERRYLLVGHSLTDRLLLVVHGEKGDTIRIVSARRATSRERRRHEADA
jgi:uncharacterized DUF497 family protein